MAKIIIIILSLCLAAAAVRIFDRSLALDDAHQEIRIQTRTIRLLVRVANYAAECKEKCDLDLMASEFAKEYALHKEPPELQIQAVTVRFSEGRIVSVSVRD